MNYRILNAALQNVKKMSQCVFQLEAITLPTNGPNTILKVRSLQGKIAILRDNTANAVRSINVSIS